MQAERLSIDELPTSERFDQWDDEINLMPWPSHLAIDSPEHLHALADRLDLGALRLLRLAQPPAAALGTPCHVAAVDPDQYHLVLPLQGELKLGNSTRSRVFTPGDMFLADTSCPQVFHADVPRAHQHPDVAPSSLVALWLQIPRELAPLPTDLMDSLMVTPLRQHNVFGLTLSRLLVDLLRHPSFSAAQAHRLSGVLLELLAGVLGAHTSEDATSEGAHGSLFIRVQDFIQRRLEDLELTPEQIAAEHHISRRHLQRLFQQRGITVAASIRQQRLERARRDLTAPHLATHPISAIAARWGFRHAADFSRAFRAAYGVAPSDFRLARTRRRCGP